MKHILIASGLLLMAFLLVPNQSKAAECPVEIGSVIKSTASNAVYYVFPSCEKLAIRNPSVFFSYYNTWEQVENVPQSTIEALPNHEWGFIPWGPKREFKNGSLIKYPGNSQVYVLFNNTLYPISSEVAFRDAGYKFSWIEDVDNTVLDFFYISDAPFESLSKLPNGFIFKYSDSPKVYRIHEQTAFGSTAKPISNEVELQSRRYRFDRIPTVARTKISVDIDNSITNSDCRDFSAKDGDFYLCEGAANVFTYEFTGATAQIFYVSENTLYLQVNSDKVRRLPINETVIVKELSNNRSVNIEVTYTGPLANDKYGFKIEGRSPYRQGDKVPPVASLHEPNISEENISVPYSFNNDIVEKTEPISPAPTTQSTNSGAPQIKEIETYTAPCVDIMGTYGTRAVCIKKDFTLTDENFRFSVEKIEGNSVTIKILSLPNGNQMVKVGDTLTIRGGKTENIIGLSNGKMLQVRYLSANVAGHAVFNIGLN